MGIGSVAGGLGRQAAEHAWSSAKEQSKQATSSAQTVVDTAGDVLTAVSNPVGFLIDQAADVANTATQGAVDQAKAEVVAVGAEAFKAADDATGGVLSTVVNTATDLYTSAKQMAENAASTAYNALNDLTGGLLQEGVDLAGQGLSFIQGGIENAKNFLGDAIHEGAEMAKDGLGVVYDGLSSFVSGAVDTAKGIADDVGSFIGDVASGAVDAVKEGAGAVADWVSGAVDTIGSWLGIGGGDSGSAPAGEAAPAGDSAPAGGGGETSGTSGGENGGTTSGTEGSGSTSGTEGSPTQPEGERPADDSSGNVGPRSDSGMPTDDSPNSGGPRGDAGIPAPDSTNNGGPRGTVLNVGASAATVSASALTSAQVASIATVSRGLRF